MTIEVSKVSGVRRIVPLHKEPSEIDALRAELLEAHATHRTQIDASLCRLEAKLDP